MGETAGIDLFAEDIGSALTAEVLDEAVLLGTWNTAGTASSLSCPGSSAGTTSSAGTNG
ncbi:thiocillin family RiPP [Streptomyces sp. NPDC056149]|uniref:thiocillin family RiPP n=1 Tax=unclassified Streptomyces TaxID=2593676 RepID=UPI00331D470B